MYNMYFIGSLVLLPKWLNRGKQRNATVKQSTKTREILKDLYPVLTDKDKEDQVKDEVMALVMYDAENADCLAKFQVVKENSNCLFARKAKLWGSPLWKSNLKLG